MSEMTREEKLDRFRGCLIGLAIGDALGAPVEMDSPGFIDKHYGLIDDYMTPRPGHFHYGSLVRGQLTDFLRCR